MRRYEETILELFFSLSRIASRAQRALLVLVLHADYIDGFCELPGGQLQGAVVHVVNSSKCNTAASLSIPRRYGGLK